MKRTDFFIPSRKFVQNLQVGDLAPDWAGRWMEVVEIFGQKNDIHGMPYVCYYIKFGEDGSKISHSLKAGELDRNIKITRDYKSAELDDIETVMNERGISSMSLDEYNIMKAGTGQLKSLALFSAPAGRGEIK